MAHSNKKIKAQNKSRREKRKEAAELELQELSDQAESIVRQIRDVTQDDEQFQSIEEQALYAIAFYKELTEHLEELYEELQQVRLFYAVASDRKEKNS